MITNIHTNGPRFTWSNRRKGVNLIKEKLDRFLANRAWKIKFPKASATNLGFYGSDHRAIKIKLNHKIWVRKNVVTIKKFVFENK